MMKIIGLLLILSSLRHACSGFEFPPLPALPPLPPPPPILTAQQQHRQLSIITKNSSKPKIEMLQQVHFKNPSNNYMTIMKNVHDSRAETIIRNIHNSPPVTANQESHVNSRDEVCQSAQCVISASKMERLIDWKVDPCEDFYEFACGRFVRDSTLHDRRDTLNIFTMTDDKLKDQLRRLFVRKIESDEIQAFRIVKELFKSCLATDQRDVRGIDPLRELIDAAGGWPMLANSGWNENTWDLEKSILMLRKYTTGKTNNIFRRAFQMRGLVNENLPFGSLNENAVENEMHKSLLKFEHILEAFKGYLIDTATIIGANRRIVESQIDDALKFEKELIKLNSRVVQQRGVAFESAFNSEIYVKYSLTQWMDVFYPLPLPANALIDNGGKKLNKIAFLEAFEDLLSKTSKRTLANYFILRIIAFSAPHTTSDIKKIQLSYKMKLLGVKQKEEAWKGCVDVISNVLQLAVESMFSQEYFDLESKQTAIDIALRIKNIFENRLVTLSWINLQQRAQILHKMNEIIAALLFPKEMLSEREVNLFYRNVSIQPEKYLEALLNLTIFNADHMFLRKQLGIGTEFEQSGSVGVLNYVDVKDFNKILFPAGVLQREVLSPERPLYLNFASSGFIIGYIFAKSFENFQQSHLPSNVSAQINCFIRQYDSYKDAETGIRNNGRDTLEGNLADNGSLRAVYTAYKKWILENGNEERLPALEFSNEQFFWIAFAQLFCTVSRPEKQRNLNGINSNSIEKFRVIGALSNSHEFARDFKCKRNVPMNPTTKCEWI